MCLCSKNIVGSKTSSSSKDGNSSITATPAAVTVGTEPSEGNDCTDEVCPIPTVNENNEPVYAIVSPVGYHAVEMIEQAQRLDTLDGKRIALVGGSFMAVTKNCQNTTTAGELIKAVTCDTDEHLA